MIKEIKRLFDVYTKGFYRWTVLFPSMTVVTYLIIQSRLLNSVERQFGTFLGWVIYVVVGTFATMLGFLLIALSVDLYRKSQRRRKKPFEIIKYLDFYHNQFIM